MPFKILTINPGSTSTKIGFFEDEKMIFDETIRHTNDELSKFPKIIDQYHFRTNCIRQFLNNHHIEISDITAIVGRGGLLKPIPSGTFEVNDSMIDFLKSTSHEHASNLGAIIAKEIADAAGIKAYIVDPVVVDEMDDLARIAGHSKFERISIFHALNQKATARLAAKELGISYSDGNFIVAHLGGGISVGLHKKGKVIDVNNALDGEGPFSPERSGSLPAGQLVSICFSGNFGEKEIRQMIKGNGGFVNYLGTNDARIVEKRVMEGDPKATLIYNAMAYQISKEIGSLAVVVSGKVDGIVLTGGLAYDNTLMTQIKNRVEFIAPVFIFAGEEESRAMAMGALRVLSGDEKAQIYTNGEKK